MTYIASFDDKIMYWLKNPTDVNLTNEPIANYRVQCKVDTCI